MSERDDYAEPGPPPLWERPAIRRWAIRSGLVGLSIVLGAIIFVAVTARVTAVSSPIHLTFSRAGELAFACREYRDRHPDRLYPVKLTDLAVPSVSGGPFIDNSERSFTDGWGNPFRYALVPNAAGELEPHIWAERTVDGKTTLHGAKLAADGTVVTFGVPEE
jgi:hypothetical protein